MVDFAIIIPVYNAEKTLNRCLDSIRFQTEKNFEVIMIDDGSTDDSKSICLDYTEIDPRFLYYYQPNQGPSAARNKGISLSNSKYVLFVDSDDYISETYLYEITLAINKNNADMIFFGYKKISSSGNVLETHIPSVSNRKDIVQSAVELSDRDLFGYTCIKAFRKETINDIEFNENISILEDELFTCSVLFKCKTIDVICKPIYYYTTPENSNSLVFRTYDNYCEISDMVFLAWKKLLQNNFNSNSILSKMSSNTINKCMYYFYERDVNTNIYIKQLSDSNFFNYIKPNSLFTHKVKSKSYFLLNLMRFIYRIKINLHKSITKIIRGYQNASKENI